jgi:hypothetical protein
MAYIKPVDLGLAVVQSCGRVWTWASLALLMWSRYVEAMKGGPMGLREMARSVSGIRTRIRFVKMRFEWSPEV